MNIPTIIGVIVIAIVAYLVSLYNWFAQTKVRIQASIQEIGNQLKRQSELIPNLETSVKAYLKHEKDILKLLSDARKQVETGQDASATISQILPKIQAVMESNPQLKGADVIQNLMGELRDTSDKVMYSRRSLIDLSADFNAKLVAFPANLVANAFGFKPERGLESPTSGSHLVVSSTDTQTPKISL